MTDRQTDRWKTFCQTGATFPRHTSARGQPKRLEEPELDLIQLLIKCRPSITYKDIKENIEAHSTATASISAIGRAVRDRLPEGKMSWKKMIRPAGEKFTADNIAYCQSFIDFMNTVPNALNFSMKRVSNCQIAQTRSTDTR